MNREIDLERQVVEVLALLAQVQDKRGEVWEEMEGLLQRELSRLEYLLGR